MARAMHKEAVSDRRTRDAGDAHSTDAVDPVVELERQNQRLIHHLGERVKELTALHETARILQRCAHDAASALKQVVALLPPAWQYPEVTAARIYYGDIDVATAGFRPDSAWMQTASFETADGRSGTIEVEYLAETPPEAEGPFLAEERNLINSLAEMLKSFLDAENAQREVREREARFRLVFDSNLVPMIFWKVAGDTIDIVDCNDAYLRLTGFTREEFKDGKVRCDLITPPDQHALDEKAIRSAAERQSAFTEPYEKTYVLRDGSPVTVRVAGAFERGQYDRGMAFFVDLTEIKERLKFESLVAELSACFVRLQDEEVDNDIQRELARLGEFLGIDRFSIFEVLDPSGTIRMLNSWATGTVQPLPGDLDASLFPHAVRTLMRGDDFIVPRVSELGPEAAREKLYFTSQGIKSHLSIPLKVGGTVLGALTCGSLGRERDWPPELIKRLRLIGSIFATALTRRRAALRLRLQQAELMHVERVASLGELAGALVHELKQPLTAIVANAEATRRLLLAEQEGKQGPEVLAALNDVTAVAERAGDLIKKLRSLLRKDEQTRESLDINQVIRDVEPVVRLEVHERGMKLEFDLAKNLPRVAGDSVQIQQVLLNLIRNGCEAMKGARGCRVIVRSTRDVATGGVRVSVRDFGPPITDESLEKLFRPFYTTKSDGLGIGLSISQTIIKSHRGELWAERNTDGKGGLIVHFSLPPADLADQVEAKPS